MKPALVDDLFIHRVMTQQRRVVTLLVMVANADKLYPSRAPARPSPPLLSLAAGPRWRHRENCAAGLKNRVWENSAAGPCLHTVKMSPSLESHGENALGRFGDALETTYLYEYVAGRAVTELDPAGFSAGPCPPLRTGTGMAAGPVLAKHCPPWGSPYPQGVQINMTVKYALFGRPKGLCALVSPTALANCRSHFGWQGAFFGAGCAGFKFLINHLGYDNPCKLAATELAAAQKAKLPLEYFLPCPPGGKCCDKRLITGAHPVNITLVVSTPGCTLTAVLSGTVTSTGYTGNCK